jgi:glucose/arabinose dehydrogenase/PKD repeat protein
MEARTRTIHSWRLIAAVLCGWLAALAINAAAAGASTVPPNFEDTLVTKVSGPTAFTFTPDGRLLIDSQYGTLHIYKNGAQLPAPALDLTNVICSDKERGLLGVAVDPAFTSNHYIYLYYTFKKFGNCDYSSPSGPVNRMSRFILNSNDVVDPASEVVLLDNIPSPDGIHNAGDLNFGKDGNLYISVGDGGCDYAGNSGCGRTNDAARDLNVLLGKILRITPSGGIPATNPYRGTDSARCNLAGRTDPGKKCQETFSWGLRNPFQAAFDPNDPGTRFFINDVGQATWEEIDLGQAGADFGWNVREGHCATASTTDCGPPPAGMTNPIYDYPHSSGCTAATAAAFVPAGVWPAQYDNAYLFGDFVCGKIIRLTPATGGGFTATDFVTGLGSTSITTMSFGPYATGQALYYMNFLNGGEIRRIAYTGTANRTPVAVAGANPTSGPAPLTVSFNSTGTSDPDGDPLTYDWDFGDGSAHSTSAAPSHTYTAAGTYTATLRVQDGRGGAGTATVRIDSGNTPPVPTIQTPTASKRFAVGEVVTLSGSATDAQDGTLPNASLSWTVVKHHDTHTHPFLPPTSGNNVPITGPDPEDLAATTTTYLEISLTATDSQGLSQTVTRNLYPNLVNLNFATSPAGLRLKVNGDPITTPRTFVSWQGWSLNIDAPDHQTDATGRPMAFGSWSDGGAAAHTILTGSSPAAYTASFKPLASFVFGDGFESGGLSAWTSVTGLGVQQQEVFAGAYAARQTSTGAATYAYKQVSPALNDLYVRLRFKVLSQGQNNVTLGKIAATGGNSILAFYRSSSGTLGLRNDVLGTTTASATVATSGIWHELLVHAAIDSGGKTEVWLDGTPVSDLTTAQSLGSNPIGRVQIGNNQTGRTYDVALDDAAVSMPITWYPRPVSAHLVTVHLVPAFRSCSAANASHAAPLALSSCSPPVQSSGYLTVGTPDVNGKEANSTGSVQLEVTGESPIDPTNGDQADVRIAAQVTDVRKKSDLSDYAGELQVNSAIRITDRYNGALQDEPGTTSDIPFGFPMSCSVTAEAGIGSTCRASTTADALSAGTVKEGKRGVWMLGPIEVYDGGADGVASTAGDNTLFLRQGLFMP